MLCQAVIVVLSHIHFQALVSHSTCALKRNPTRTADKAYFNFLNFNFGFIKSGLVDKSQIRR